VERANGAAPALGDVLELAVTVELVAEEVPEADRTRVQALGNLGKRRLVDFEQSELGVAHFEERGRDARDEIRARPVVRQTKTLPGDPGRQRRRGRLPVGRGAARRPEGGPRGEPIHRTGIELPEQLSGDGGAAAGPGEA